MLIRVIGRPTRWQRLALAARILFTDVMVERMPPDRWAGRAPIRRVGLFR